MNTECKPEQLEYQSLGRREVIGRFDGGRITSDGGGLLLREVDQRIGLLDRLAACFTDHRNPESIRCQPWRAKRRLVDPSSREAALLTRRAHSARGEAK